MRRNPVIAALLLAQSLAPSFAQGISRDSGQTRLQTGIIIGMDPVGMSFVVQNRAVAREIWATRATRFRSNRLNPSFFGLSVGRPVTVTFHDSGPLEIADAVTF
jgi:hypothetical protein